MTQKTITTKQLCDGIKSLISNESPYAVSRYLEASVQSGYNWCDGKQVMDDRYAIKAAAALNLDVDYVLACLAAERAVKASNAESAVVWHRIALRLATAASLAALGFWLPVLGFFEAVNYSGFF